MPDLDLPLELPEFEEGEELSLLVLIVCFRAADLTVDCLKTLVPQVREIEGARVAVCENGTGPESVETIRRAIEQEGFGDRVGLKVISPNRGFSGGNNAVLREVMAWPKPPRYVLLLNSDTLLHEGALASMFEAIDARPDVGVLGPRVEWLGGEVQNTTYRYRTPLTEMLMAARTDPLTRLFPTHTSVFPIPDRPFDTEWLTFACAIIRRETLQQVGVLDDGYYLYYDDLDYCLRAKRAGYRILYWPYARVVHLRGQSNPLKTLALEFKRRPRYFYASRARYFAKFYGQGGLLLTNFLWCLGRAVSLARETFGGKGRHICEREGRDIWTNWLDPMQPPRREDAQQ